MGRIVLAILIAVVLPGCRRKDTSLKITGSDTMVQLAQHLVKAYLERNPGQAISVQGGGSGTGIAALLNGATDIASASREMKVKEWELAKSKGLNIKEYTIALDALAVVVHPTNKISRLTLAQLSDIYAGKITNWKELGGADMEILAISRENNSGTHVYFKEHVLRLGREASKGEAADPIATREFGPKVTYGVSSQAISDQVKKNPAAIGYFGMGWVSKEVKVLEISSDGKNYYLPTAENVRNKKYPIARSLHMYLNMASGERAQSFMDFVMSAVGQKIVREQDFVPIIHDG
ncbi:MAG: phosphate ABC transporter substrate-binding protein [Turneriella sp.]|nr:phosphate ABC transporter substrate-binding protein [Leptospiraceae bacterium]MCX7632010.1 phosphate ABC transporter substrate-binding protein [Turneriella sp.]